MFVPISLCNAIGALYLEYNRTYPFLHKGRVFTLNTVSPHTISLDSFAGRLKFGKPSIYRLRKNPDYSLRPCCYSDIQASMNVESWCAVELTSDQDWMRKAMRHYPDTFKSTVFSQDPAQQTEEPKEKIKLDLDKLAKRKHFPQKCELYALQYLFVIKIYIFLQIKRH